jgi:hypothetical protein
LLWPPAGTPTRQHQHTNTATRAHTRAHKIRFHTRGAAGCRGSGRTTTRVTPAQTPGRGGTPLPRLPGPALVVQQHTHTRTRALRRRPHHGGPPSVAPARACARCRRRHPHHHHPTRCTHAETHTHTPPRTGHAAQPTHTHTLAQAARAAAPILRALTTPPPACIPTHTACTPTSPTCWWWTSPRPRECARARPIRRPMSGQPVSLTQTLCVFSVCVCSVLLLCVPM